MIKKYYIYKYDNYNKNKIYELNDTIPENYIISDSETPPPKYHDITSIQSWNDMGKVDYVFRRKQIELYTINIGFLNLSYIDKEIVLKYCAETPEILIEYIMNKEEITQEEAYDKYLMFRSINIKNSSKCFENRIYNSNFTKNIIKYLGFEGGEIFLNECRNFILDLKDISLLGTNYGNIRDGIMDYIESTGSYVNGGLLNYTIQPGLTREDLIQKLKKIIYYGDI